RPRHLQRRAVGGLRVQPQRRTRRETGMVAACRERHLVHCRTRHGPGPRAAHLPLRRRADATMSRLPPMPGEGLARATTPGSRFEGEPVQGFAGDTVSSAMWAAGHRVLGRSFKYHRPRGILSMANHDVNALMQDGEVLNLRADVTPLRDGMQLEAVNTFGGLRHDRAR